MSQPHHILGMVIGEVAVGLPFLHIENILIATYSFAATGAENLEKTHPQL